jgi:ribulose-phosphate 3-epimerase
MPCYISVEKDCGISISPSTDVNEIVPLLKSGLVSVVDVLAVEPGFGGQKFQDIAYKKIAKLIEFREQNDQISFDIMVDGGINENTAANTGADILVAGTFLFKHPDSFATGVRSLVAAAAKSIGRTKV